MSDHGREPEPAPPPRRIRTACHNCHGQGVVWAHRFAIIDGLIGTKGVWEKCTSPGCKDGWLDGLRPPA